MLVLDFAKAFDTVAHERLLAKIHSYGIIGSLYKWIESFLKGQTQRVVVEGESSAEARGQVICRRLCDVQADKACK